MKRKLSGPDVFEDVLEFQQTFCPEAVGYLPEVPSVQLQRQRLKLVVEEMCLLLEKAVGSPYELDHIPEVLVSIIESNISTNTKLDLQEMACAAARTVYAIISMCVTYGIDLRPVWQEVHRAMMMLETDADGNIVKGEHYQPADMQVAFAAMTPLKALPKGSA